MAREESVAVRCYWWHLTPRCSTAQRFCSPL